MRTVKDQKGNIQRVYTLRVDPEKLALIHQIAESEHRTLSGKLRAMIDEEIARAESRRAA